MKTIVYKHAQDNHIHVYQFGSHVHEPRHVSSKQNNCEGTGYDDYGIEWLLDVL